MFPLLFEGIDIIHDLVHSLRRREPLIKDVAPVVNKMMGYIEGLGVDVKKN